MSKIQLYLKDEYGQISFLESFATLKAATDFIKTDLRRTNIDSGYVEEYVVTSWDNYMVEIKDEKGEELFYGGNQVGGKPCAYKMVGNKIEKVMLTDPKKFKIKIFLGAINNKTYYAKDGNKEISELNSPALEFKNHYYIEVQDV